LEISAQAVEARVEADHWWFRGRRQLLGAMIRELGIRRDARTLDVGSGTGANLRLLAELGFERVSGLDCSEEAIRYCGEKALPRVELGDLCDLPFAEGDFDLVIAADVLEHVEDEARAIGELRRVLQPGGRLIVTVPAFQSLWGLQDQVSHHKRRYRRRELESRLRDGGLEVARSFYFNYLLFAPIWLARRLLRILRVELASENELNTSLLNALLARVFSWDVRSAPRLRPAFGVSILALARRPAQG
jgi:SAM-dependent methyltransferase